MYGYFHEAGFNQKALRVSVTLRLKLAGKNVLKVRARV